MSSSQGRFPRPFPLESTHSGCGHSTPAPLPAAAPGLPPPRLFCWRLALDPLQDLGQAGENREERQRPQLPEYGNRPSQAKSSALSPQDLPPKARSGIAPSTLPPPPRAQSHAHPYPGERRAPQDRSAIFLPPWPTLYVPLQPSALLSLSDSSPASNLLLNPQRLPDQTSHSPSSFPHRLR
ncbi:hypothetical protein PAL_GLEAN10025215 [Pteropus alecto]|uniref:Uncharacterized protein n=1 Tax=Pteropus alecto TaxID=9402 RepID=L5JL35_PTEAL|nr:hypothetical protein PAL_GLEAN10025215 [Pteropus alecto]